jgi:ATP-binding cassette subfamily F protein 3
VVISHDRAFVDNITNRTIEVMGRIYDYKANTYLELRKTEGSKAYDEQQRMIADNRTLLTVLKVHFQNRCNRV